MPPTTSWSVEVAIPEAEGLAELASLRHDFQQSRIYCDAFQRLWNAQPGDATALAACCDAAVIRYMRAFMSGRRTSAAAARARKAILEAVASGPLSQAHEAVREYRNGAVAHELKIFEEAAVTTMVSNDPSQTQVVGLGTRLFRMMTLSQGLMGDLARLADLGLLKVSEEIEREEKILLPIVRAKVDYQTLKASVK